MEVQDTSTIVRADNRHNENSERRSGHSEKVDRDKFQEVIIKESPSGFQKSIRVDS
jgi:hypothetical protein